MRVLYVVPDGEDLGGIITTSEQLMQGFRENGHEAKFCLLRPTTKSGESRYTRMVGQGGDWIRSPHTGMLVHPVYGFKGPYISMAIGMREFTALAVQHDVVVWGAMFGLRNALTEGSTHWTRLFSEHGKPNVVMISDDHLRDRYPWVAMLAPHVHGWVGVQRSSYDSIAGLGRRSIIYVGHDVSPVDGPLLREPVVFSCQTFKRWKRADRFVAAAPYMVKQGLKPVLSGDGIELRYMRSKEKCRPAYRCTLATDPEAPPERYGQRLWDIALDHGMNYVGALAEHDRDAWLKQARLFVDLSTRAKSTGQINRTVVEAIRHGAVPVAVPQFLSGHPYGQGELFKAHEHYLPIFSDSSPQSLANMLKLYAGMSEEEREYIIREGRKLIQRFDRKLVAQQLVDFGLGKPAGLDYREDPLDPDLQLAGKRMFRELFGEPPA